MKPLRSILILAVSAAAERGAALAQDPPPDDVIVVTGTRIPRKDYSTASPVATYDRADVTEFGVIAVEEFLNSLPQVSPDLGKTSNNPGDGAAAINLRGLGRGRTLVLLDGRRLGTSGVTSSIDANAIPSAIIERVEVVTGGASAVYGSDAVTGAVNFITRKNFTGLELSSQFDIYGAGDGETYDASLAAGTDFAGDRGHLSIFADYYRRTSVFQGDREFTKTVLSEVDGVLVPTGSFNVPGSATLEPDVADSLFFNPDGTVRPFEVPGDLYNFAPPNYLQTPLTRWSAGAFAEFDAAANVTLYAELLYSGPKVERRLAAAAADFAADFSINAAFFAPSAIGVLTSRYDPDGDGVGSALFSTRFEGVGSRTAQSARDYYRGVAGLRADLSANWSLDLFYSYSRNENTESRAGAVSQARVLQGLVIDPATGACKDPSNGCVATNIFGQGNLSEAVRDFIALAPIVNTFNSTQHNAAVVATGDLFSAPGGKVELSLGAEFRRNAAAAEADPVLAAGDALGFEGFAGAQGAANVYEAFGELLVPVADGQRLAQSLELEFGGRFSHYSTAGTSWTWKAGGQWIPVEGLRFSGSWQRAVRAPNVEELFTEEVRAFGFIPFAVDFCAARADPVGAGLGEVCIAQGMDPSQLGVYNPPPQAAAFPDLVSGGNPDLEVETASTITAGADYAFDAPFTLRIAADYFLIDLEDAIATLDRPLNRCAVGGDPSSAACRAVRRDPSGFPIEVFFLPANVATARASGLDGRLDFAVDAPAALGLGDDARFAIRSAATYYLKNGERQTSISNFIDCAGHFFATCANDSGGAASAAVSVPEAQVSSVFSMEKTRFTASLRWRWISGVDNLGPVLDRLAGRPPFPTAVPSVGDRHYLDLAAAAEIFDGVRLRFGVDNVLATKPPALGDEQSQANTDPSRYDVFGRRLYVGIDARFGGKE